MTTTLPAAGRRVPARLTGQLMKVGRGREHAGAPGPLCTVAGRARGANANLLALLITAVADTAANRRLTFGIRGTDRAGRHQAHGLVVFGIGLTLTSGSLALLDGATATPATWPS
jgi:hypothetical protein